MGLFFWVWHRSDKGNLPFWKVPAGRDEHPRRTSSSWWSFRLIQ